MVLLCPSPCSMKSYIINHSLHFPFSVYYIGFLDNEVAKPESVGNIVFNIVNTEAARPVEIFVITQDVSGGAGEADVGKI